MKLVVLRRTTLDTNRQISPAGNDQSLHHAPAHQITSQVRLFSSRRCEHEEVLSSLSNGCRGKSGFARNFYSGQQLACTKIALIFYVASRQQFA